MATPTSAQRATRSFDIGLFRQCRDFSCINSRSCATWNCSRSMPCTMILAVTLIIGALATYWATATAGALSGSQRSSIADVSMAMMISVALSGIVYAIDAVWSVLADSASASTDKVHYSVLHAWLVFVGPVVSLVVLPAAYATANVLQLKGFRLSDRWRTYGFPSIVAAIYVTLNVNSYLTDKVGGWSEGSLGVTLPFRCIALRCLLPGSYMSSE